MVGTALPQNGHWKSLTSAKVTFGFFGPLRGLDAGMSSRATSPAGLAADGAAAAGALGALGAGLASATSSAGRELPFRFSGHMRPASMPTARPVTSGQTQTGGCQR